MTLAPNPLTDSQTSILIFSSRSADTAVWKDRFDRYRLSTGARLTLMTFSSEAVRDRAVPDADSISGTTVLWDVDGGVPPKEIERLTAGLQPDECRVGTRFGAQMTVRGLSRTQALWGRSLGRLRRILGGSSDPQPPCLAVPTSVYDRCSNVLGSRPAHRWTSTLRAAVRKNCRVREVDVMGAVR